MYGLYLTDGSNVYSNNLDLDLNSVDSTIPNVVPPVDGHSTSGVDFLGSLSQMGDNLLRSPPHSSTQPGSTASERPSTAPESTTSTDCPLGDQDDEPTTSRRPSAPPSPQPVEQPSSTENTDVQTTPPSGGSLAAAVRDSAELSAMSASKTSTQSTTTTTTTTGDSGNSAADVDSIEFACNLSFDTTDLIDAGARHEVIDVRSSDYILSSKASLGSARTLLLFQHWDG